MLFSWIADSHVLFIFRKYNTKNPLLSFVCPAIARHLPQMSSFAERLFITHWTFFVDVPSYAGRLTNIAGFRNQIFFSNKKYMLISNLTEKHVLFMLTYCFS